LDQTGALPIDFDCHASTLSKVVRAEPPRESSSDVDEKTIRALGLFRGQQ
jgi:hypothetical protein